MAIPATFIEMVNHPAPGLHFPAHENAETPERILSSPHRMGRPADEAALQKLDELLAAAPPQARVELREFYARWNGADLCCLPYGGERFGMLSLLPIEDWEAATARFAGGDLSFCLETDNVPIWQPGEFVTIASAPSEETRLMLALAGEWEDGPLAGRICYVSGDPVHDAGAPIADSFFDLLRIFADEPAAFLEDISSTYFVKTHTRSFGDTADRYLPDCRVY